MRHARGGARVTAAIALLPIAALGAPDFKACTIDEKADMWWARAAGDLNGDGLLDVALQDNSS